MIEIEIKITIDGSVHTVAMTTDSIAKMLGDNTELMEKITKLLEQIKLEHPDAEVTSTDTVPVSQGDFDNMLRGLLKVPPPKIEKKKKGDGGK